VAMKEVGPVFHTSGGEGGGGVRVGQVERDSFVLLINVRTFDFYNFDLRGHFGGQTGQLS
jgi:hypothetical protein